MTSNDVRMIADALSVHMAKGTDGEAPEVFDATTQGRANSYFFLTTPLGKCRVEIQDADSNEGPTTSELRKRVEAANG